jgi:HD domain
MPSTASWWGSKVRQFRSHVRARVAPDERTALATWVSPPQLALFDGMHVADRRHGLDVVATLREQGMADDDVLLAGLLHDAGKGRTGVWTRVVFSLGQAYGAWVWRVAGVLPGLRAGIGRLHAHAETSARLAEQAGATPRTVELIRHQEAPVDPEAGRLLQLADEAN